MRRLEHELACVHLSDEEEIADQPMEAVGVTPGDRKAPALLLARLAGEPVLHELEKTADRRQGVRRSCETDATKVSFSRSSSRRRAF